MITMSDALALVRTSEADPDALVTVVAGMDRTELQQLAVRLVALTKMARSIGTATDSHPALSLDEWCSKMLKELDQK